MSLYEELCANNIDADKLISLQLEFINGWYNTEGTHKKLVDYKGFLEKDQLFAVIEKFINRIEREKLWQKMGEEFDNRKEEFIDWLVASNISADFFIAVQVEFISGSRNELKKIKGANYKEYLERDQVLTSFEKFINRTERDILKKKIQKVSRPNLSCFVLVAFLVALYISSYH